MEILTCGPIRMDLDAWRVFVGETEVTLSPTEFKLLRSFLEHKGTALTREDLLHYAWGYSPDVARRLETRTVDMHVRRLRKRIGEDAGAHIKTIKGRGYRIDEEI